MIEIIKCGKFHKKISKTLNILTIFAMNVRVNTIGHYAFGYMYSDLCD